MPGDSTRRYPQELQERAVQGEDAADLVSNSQRLSPPASIHPTTVSAFAPLFAPSDAAGAARRPGRSHPIRCANAATGNSSACGIFVSVKLTDTRLKS